MTFGLVLAGWWTARMNTQSSTGLLYVGLGTVIAGELAARVVFYLTGAAV
jgi:DMSO reductase anchor subunit